MAFVTLKVLFPFMQETMILMKFQDPSLHSLIIGFSTYTFDWHKVIKGNWIPRSVSPYSKCKSVDKGWVQYFKTAPLPHQRNNEIKQNIITFLTRHIFLIFSWSSIGFKKLVNLRNHVSSVCKWFQLARQENHQTELEYFAIFHWTMK